MSQTRSGLSAELSRAIEGALAPLVDAGLVAGAVVSVTDPEGTLAEVARGFSDITARRPMQPDSFFWIASQTKPVTATAFMMLFDEGKVALDDPIDEYLPEFGSMWVATERDTEHILLVPPDRRITVRDVLSHVSGMPFMSDLEFPTRDLLDLSVRVRSYAMTPLLSQPGTRYEYSNAGINTAARVIEVFSGLPYEQYLQDRLLDPLGMVDTTFFPSRAQIARLAKTYQPNAVGTALEETVIAQLHHPLDCPVRRAIPGGGLFSSSADMTAFCRMIVSGGTVDGRRYVTPEAIAQMSTCQVPAEALSPASILGARPYVAPEAADSNDVKPPPVAENSYGLGWGVREDSFQHGGALASSMAVYPDLGYAVVYLVQHMGFLGDGERCQGDVEAAVKAVMVGRG